MYVEKHTYIHVNTQTYVHTYITTYIHAYKYMHTPWAFGSILSFIGNKKTWDGLTLTKRKTKNGHIHT